jgi:UDP-N-acetylglucosamine kinase
MTEEETAGATAGHGAMSPEEERLADAAWKFAKQNRTSIARRLADTKTYPGENNPVSVFMAGSPGAGKTEASIELLKEAADDGNMTLRIDPDELRNELPGYGGGNAWLFQRAVVPLVERIFDLALQQKQSFVLDGTLSNYRVAERNIARSLEKGRLAQILYVYQEPASAWRFVQAREKLDGRQIKAEHFVDQYFAARKVVEDLKVKFGSEIKIDLLLKNLDGTRRTYFANVDQIESYVPEKFSRDDVLKIVAQPP